MDVLEARAQCDLGDVLLLADEMQPLEEQKPREVVSDKAQLEQPHAEQPTIEKAELKFTKPLEQALSPNDERVLE